MDLVIILTQLARQAALSENWPLKTELLVRRRRNDGRATDPLTRGEHEELRICLWSEMITFSEHVLSLCPSVRCQCARSIKCSFREPELDFRPSILAFVDFSNQNSDDWLPCDCKHTGSVEWYSKPSVISWSMLTELAAEPNRGRKKTEEHFFKEFSCNQHWANNKIRPNAQSILLCYTLHIL